MYPNRDGIGDPALTAKADGRKIHPPFFFQDLPLQEGNGGSVNRAMIT
jgi:hypothetical protein